MGIGKEHTMIAIIDYDAGNTFNVQKALAYIGLDAVLTADADTIVQADGVILPGVGAYAAAMTVLKERGLVEPLLEVVKQNIPLLGICLGMQLLFDESEEYGPAPGLGIIPGVVKAIPRDMGASRSSYGMESEYCASSGKCFQRHRWRIYVFCPFILCGYRFEIYYVYR